MSRLRVPRGCFSHLLFIGTVTKSVNSKAGDIGPTTQWGKKQSQIIRRISRIDCILTAILGNYSLSLLHDIVNSEAKVKLT